MLREGFEVVYRTVETPDGRPRPAWRHSRQAKRTIIQDKAAPCPQDHVDRVFDAPAANRLWVSDLTDVSIWSGFVPVAFAIDACARRIVGWRGEDGSCELGTRRAGASPAPTTTLPSPRVGALRALAKLRTAGVRDADLGRLFNHRRLPEPASNIPPAEAEERYYAC